MTDATARYVIAAEDRTKAAADSIKRNFKDIDGAARKLSRGLKGLGVGAVALKAWSTAARLGDAAIQNLASSNTKFADSLRETETAMKGLWTAGERTIETQEKLNTLLKDPAVQSSVSGLADKFGQLRLELKALLPAWTMVLQHGTDTKRVFEELAKVKAVGPQSRGYVRDLGDVDAAQKLGKSQNAAFDARMKAQADAAKAKADALEKAAADAAKDLAKWNDDFNKAPSDLTDDAHDEIARVVGDTLETQQTFLGSSKQVFDEYLKGLQPVAKESFEQMSAYAADFARSIDGNIKQALLNMEGGFRGFAKSAIDSLRDVLAEIMSVKLRMAVFGNVDSSGNLSGGLLSTAINGLFGMFGGSGAGPTTLPGGGISNFSGPRADGGPVDMGRSYLVGERGPELFTPGRSGVISPNASEKRALTVHVTNNVNASQLTQDQAARMVADSQRMMWDELDRRYGLA